MFEIMLIVTILTNIFTAGSLSLRRRSSLHPGAGLEDRGEAGGGRGENDHRLLRPPAHSGPIHQVGIILIFCILCKYHLVYHIIITSYPPDQVTR